MKAKLEYMRKEVIVAYFNNPFSHLFGGIYETLKNPQSSLPDIDQSSNREPIEYEAPILTSTWDIRQILVNNAALHAIQIKFDSVWKFSLLYLRC
jgi:hypothetical protein